MPRASLLIVLWFCAMICGCSSLPAVPERAPEHALAQSGDTRLGRALAGDVAAHPGRTAVHPLPGGLDAFAARMLLARTAERSIDAQYYIWHDDITGSLMTQALWEAAERGVRVRLLLDDANTGGLDPLLAMLDGHPNIEVRLFNPFANRSWRLGDFAVDFSRVNRRMHNKSFTVDNQVSVVGGRNIGDEYFGAAESLDFADLDVAVAGAVVRDVSSEFDNYWNSASAYPVAGMLAPVSDVVAQQLRDGWEEAARKPEAQRYMQAVRDTTLVADVLSGQLRMEWVPARLVSDDPAKVLNPPERHDLHMLPRLEEALGRPLRELDLVSPYFVPAQEGTSALLAIAQRGVKVRVLTNSLAATDVLPVYAGYARYREPLLGGGVQLFELKPTAEVQRPKTHVIGKSGSQSGLHAKTFAVDRERIFVGSFNLDPRSARLNTEMGVVLTSTNLAGRLSSLFDDKIRESAYEVRPSPEGAGLVWVDRTSAGEAVHASEPGSTAWKRFEAGFLSLLPVEWML
ncbi:phospholipase D family protein [Ramlibacter sp. G-1-2-2]|uniref:Phospholipase D family protein n=1 Tax=Ramlibacter agri TaxID=2728837 RepID=A0A848H0D8_9BURK|nr:phospholipase D family protein [Ramlibacter agri]NML44275.1 phospholipase D family protein [Ramlibacter agri]